MLSMSGTCSLFWSSSLRPIVDPGKSASIVCQRRRAGQLPWDDGGPVVRPRKHGDSQFLLSSFQAMAAASPGSLTSYLRAMAKAVHQQHGSNTCRCSFSSARWRALRERAVCSESVELTKTLRQELALAKLLRRSVVQLKESLPSIRAWRLF